MATPNPQPIQLAGSGFGAETASPIHATLSPRLVAWMSAHDLALAFTTSSAGRLVLIAPGRHGGIALSERNFGQATILRATETGFYLSTKYQLWQFENKLQPDQELNGWDRLYMPRRCEVTGNVDIHDMHVGRDGRLLVAVTHYNCNYLAQMDRSGSFSPIWKPPFIDALVNEDRCHFNGFCLEDGVPAYATVTGPSNTAGGWRDMCADGGQVIDMRDNSIVADGLAMPRAPRIHRGRLYVLEAGSGWFGYIDGEVGRFERLVWCPGVLSGLAFAGDYAIIGLSKPRKGDCTGLPLRAELERRGQEPECAIYVLRLSDGQFCHGQLCHNLTITGPVDEICDTAVLTGTRQPLLAGPEHEELEKCVELGADTSGAMSTSGRFMEPQIIR